MVQIGTPYTKSTTKVLLLGSGELGKEVCIELQRLGVEVVAVDRYDNAPAMHVAHRSYTISMLDAEALTAVIEKENPDLIIPEIEAIATDVLLEVEAGGRTVVPTAMATKLTMNREGIRRLAAEELGIKTSLYKFAETREAFDDAVSYVGTPCVVKPIMSSSGKGQSVIKTSTDQDRTRAWAYAQEGGRAGKGKVIVEGFIDFDYEITLLTIRHAGGTSFCAPIGHIQIDGDYRESWQPHPMSDQALLRSQECARKVTDALGGHGVFGVELFIKGDEVYFSEVSPRPHDTGLVTLISQDLSEFALHARAVLGLPIPLIEQYGPSASVALLGSGESSNITFIDVEDALKEPGTNVRLFGKPEIAGKRRLGVTLARGATLEEARKKAAHAAAGIKVCYS